MMNEKISRSNIKALCRLMCTACSNLARKGNWSLDRLEFAGWVHHIEGERWTCSATPFLDAAEQLGLISEEKDDDE